MSWARLDVPSRKPQVGVAMGRHGEFVAPSGVIVKNDAARPAIHPCLLVVEDDIDVATTIEEIGKEEGFRVVCAGNGKAALEILASTQPTLMLVDLFMPVMGG